MATKKTRVCLIDDHEMFRNCIKKMLEDTGEFEVVSEGSDGNKAIELSAQKNFDIMILDISMPNKSGVDALKSIKKNSSAPVLMLSMQDESQYAIRCLKQGASGYISKKSSSEELLIAIRTVSKNRKYFSQDVAQMLAERLSDNHNGQKHEKLSDREFQVLTLIGSGMNLTEIGLKLNISVKTVSEYKTRVKEKMSFRHNNDLMSYVIKNNLSIAEVA